MRKTDVVRGTCSYCGKENVLLNSTPETNDAYCKECLELIISNCEIAMREIDEYEQEEVI